jgi:hypothetical protein
VAETFDRNPKSRRRMTRAFQTIEPGTTVINNPGGGDFVRGNNSIGPSSLPIAAGGAFVRLGNAASTFSSGLALRVNGTDTDGAPLITDADASNGLKVVAVTPLANANSGLTLRYGNGLTVNTSSQLVVLAATNVGLSVGAGGVTTVFKTNGGLAADSGGMYIVLASVPGLSIGGCGTTNGLCVLLKSGGGISKDADGLYLTSPGGSGDLTLVDSGTPAADEIDLDESDNGFFPFAETVTLTPTILNTAGNVVKMSAWGTIDISNESSPEFNLGIGFADSANEASSPFGLAGLLSDAFMGVAPTSSADMHWHVETTMVTKTTGTSGVLSSSWRMHLFHDGGQEVIPGITYATAMHYSVAPTMNISGGNRTVSPVVYFIPTGGTFDVKFTLKGFEVTAMS